MKALTTTAVFIALNIESIGAQRRTLPFSKAHKELVIGSKTSKATSKDAWLTETPMSLSLSLSTVPLDDSEFDSQLFTPISSPHTPSPGTAGAANKFIPSNYPSVALSNPMHPLQGISFAPSNGGFVDGNFTDVVWAPALDDTAAPSYYPDALINKTSKVDGCIAKGHKDVVSSEVELLYFYRLESSSFDPSIIDEVEMFLVEIACNLTGAERKLRVSNTTFVRIIAASKFPKDVVSVTYTCIPREAQVHDCHVIEGGLTIKVEGNTESIDEMLPILFESLAIGDPNIIELEYLENIALLDQIGGHNNAKGSDGSGSSSLLPISAIAASCLVIVGALGTSLVLFFGRTKGPLRSVVRYEDESPVPATTNLPTVPLPTQQSNLEHDDLMKIWPNPFIVAEEEETTWQSLGILPMLSPRRLESIREEMSIESDEYYDEGSI